MATSSTKLAPLETISYERLLSGCPTEHARLLDAARSPGFFYLNLRSPATNHYVNCVDDLYPFAKTYFDQPEDVKMADYREDIEYGYKPSILDASLEFPFDILTAPIRSASARSAPKPGTIPAHLTHYTSAIHTFTSVSHTIAHTLLSSLGASLGLTDAFSAAHAAHLPSACGLKFVNEPLQPTIADVVENKHTDGGSLTLLFTRGWGTQVCLRGDEWGFIESREGCAIVNVADSLARLTGGRWGVGEEQGEQGEKGLRSAVHRVSQPTDGAGERMFVLYFLRPGKAE